MEGQLYSLDFGALPRKAARHSAAPSYIIRPGGSVSDYLNNTSVFTRNINLKKKKYYRVFTINLDAMFEML